MTMEEIKAMTRETLTPGIVAQVIGSDPQYLRLMARQRPEGLGFPTICVGNRVKIPRMAFIRFMEGER